MKTVDYWQHKSGDVYAVISDTAAFGPLTQDEIGKINIDDERFQGQDAKDDFHWLNSAPCDYYEVTT